jgi:putative MATE family efflux protein
MNRKSRNLTEGNIIKNITYLALPTIVTSALWDLFNIVDMIFVGKLGPPAIAAVSMCGIMMGIIFTIATGITTGSIALISRFFGSKDYQTADLVVVQILFLSILSSLIISVVGFLLAKPVILLLGARETVVTLGTQYFKIISIGSFSIFITFALASSLRAAGDAVTPMKALIVSTVLNIILDPLLIFGLWIFPRMGVAGSAIATVIARSTGMVILLFVFLKGKSHFHLHFKNIRIAPSMIWRILRIGFFGSLQVLQRNVSMLILLKIVAQFGTATIAAYGIGMRLRLVTMMPGFGFSQASAVLVGQNLGAGKPQRAAKSAWTTVGLYEIIMIVFVVVLFLFAPWIIKGFNSDPDVVKMGSNLIRIISLALVFLAISLVIGRSFNGAGDTLSPMIVTGFSLLLFQIPVVLILSRFFDTSGIWWGIALSDVVQAGLMSGWFLRGKWKEKKI